MVGEIVYVKSAYCLEDTTHLSCLGFYIRVPWLLIEGDPLTSAKSDIHLKVKWLKKYKLGTCSSKSFNVIINSLYMLSLY